MLRQYLTSSLTLTAALGLATGACKPREAADDRATTAAVSDSATQAGDKSETPGMARKIGELTKLQNPESAKYDADQDLWYVTNVNGNPLAKDNNGYISRLTADGKVDSLKFIVAGKNGVKLNAPKGMALTGDTLWVADIDALRAFNKRTGAPITSVSMVGQAKFLNDVAVGPDGALYVTDTGVIPDPKTGMAHTGPDRIFRVAGGKASIALQSPQLAGPNGITWDSAANHFVIVPFAGNAIVAWRPGEKTVQPIATGPGQEDGVEVLPGGRLLVTSWADSSLFVVENGQATTIAKGVPSPADIGLDTKRSRVAVPLLMENRVEFWQLP